MLIIKEIYIMKILVVQLGRIGDMILLTPVFASIKKKYPDAEIHLLSGRHNHNVANYNPYINKIHIYHKKPLKILSLIKELRSENFDYWIDPKDHYSTESRVFAQLTNAKVKIGYNPPDKNNFDFAVPSNNANEGKHFTERAFNALIPLGIEKPVILPRPELYYNADNMNFEEKFLSALAYKNFILINIFASSESRMWEDIKWRELVEKIQSKYPVVLSAQTIQLNRVLPIASGFANVKIFESRTIIDMFALTEKAMLLITPDTSVVHIAAAYNVPTLGLYNYFQETNSKFRPVSAKSMMLTTQEGGGNLKNLSVEEVFSAFEKLITELN